MPNIQGLLPRVGGESKSLFLYRLTLLYERKRRLGFIVPISAYHVLSKVEKLLNYQMKIYFKINNVAKMYIVGVIFLKLPHTILITT